MAYLQKRVSVAGAEPDKVLDGDEGASALVRNTHATVSVFVGDEDVATSDGYEVPAGDAIRVPLGGRDDDLYAIAASGTVALHVLINT